MSYVQLVKEVSLKCIYFRVKTAKWFFSGFFHMLNQVFVSFGCGVFEVERFVAPQNSMLYIISWKN